MRVTRGETTWILHPTTPQEEEIFAAIVRNIPSGEEFNRNEWDRPEGSQATALISVGSQFFQFRGQRHPNVTWCTWIGGIVIPFVVPDDNDAREMLDTMGVCGLTYVGPVGDSLEVYGTKCQYCGRQMIDPRQCINEVCAICAAACEHKVWEHDNLVGTADGGVAMGEQCTHCKLTRGPATDDRADVERTTGILVITRGVGNVREAVNTLLLPNPDIDN